MGWDGGDTAAWLPSWCGHHVPSHLVFLIPGNPRALLHRYAVLPAGVQQEGSGFLAACLCCGVAPSAPCGFAVCLSPSPKCLIEPHALFLQKTEVWGFPQLLPLWEETVSVNVITLWFFCI